MNFLEYTFQQQGGIDAAEILIAYLDAAGYEGFIDSGSLLQAYIQVENRDEKRLKEIMASVRSLVGDVYYTVSEIPEKNWNEAWERDFQPVEVSNKVRIRASFHSSSKDFLYDLLIDPKMSFGTGHHATTRLMVQSMLQAEFEGKSVLDMGCGTGVLGILAYKLGADNVVGVDIDKWACTNAKENAYLNHCEEMEIIHGSAESLRGRIFDVILANINRNVLLESIKVYQSLLSNQGLLILSGILTEDVEDVDVAAEKAGFKKSRILEEEGWCSIEFQKAFSCQ